MLRVLKIQRLNLSILASRFQNKLLPLAALHPHFKFLSDLWHWYDLLISMSATCRFNWVPQTWLSCTAVITNNLSDNVMPKLKNSLRGAATGDCSFAQKQQKQRQGRLCHLLSLAVNGQLYVHGCKNHATLSFAIGKLYLPEGKKVDMLANLNIGDASVTPVVVALAASYSLSWLFFSCTCLLS